MNEKWHKMFPKATSNVVKYLVDGINTFEEYVKAIETAKAPGHYIYIMGWMLDAGFPLVGKRNPNYGKKDETYYKGDKTLFNLLDTATSKGVEVRILVWRNPLYIVKNKKTVEDISKLRNTKIFIDDYTFPPEDAKKMIAQHETRIRDLIQKVMPILTNPAARIKEQYKDKLDGLELSDIFETLVYYLNHKNVAAHHEKVLIVKGENGLISFCGGIDINQNRFVGLHDTACKVMGPEAHQILNKFIKRWNNHGEAKSIQLKGSNDIKPQELGPIAAEIFSATVVGTYNSPDGKEKDRSVKDAYLKIIAAARNYIYIEDQYLVNLDVAKALNKKIKEWSFKKLIILIQESSETTDIMIPDKRRGEFFKALLENTTKEEKLRVAIFLISKDRARFRHTAVHAKTLIVDDELAIIGSANVNQRSFTTDSETSIIIFNSPSDYYRDNFAYKFRNSLWHDLMHKDPLFPDITWEEFVRYVYTDENYTLLQSYRNDLDDLDVRIARALKPATVPMVIGIGVLTGNDLQKTLQVVSVVNNPLAITAIIELIFDNIIDPTVK